METLKEKQLKVLNDTVAIYNKNNRSIIDGKCLYFMEGTIGCAVGRLIADKELCKQLDGLDNGETTGVGVVFDKLPSDVKQLGVDFLKELQNLHDDVYTRYWDDNGLSIKGVEFVERIKQVFELN